MKTALVLGAGGFIGSHMVKRLKAEGYWVRGVDLKHPDFSDTAADEFIVGDLREQNFVERVIQYKGEQGNYYHDVPYQYIRPFDEIYQFAADMGGAGYIFTGEHDADIMHNSASINLNLLGAVHAFNLTFDGVDKEWTEAKRPKLDNPTKIFYSSSACMYPEHNQLDPDNPDCREESAYPAAPDSEYGWEKLFSERIYLAFARNYNVPVRIARYHNIFGPDGTWFGGKEKAPAAICRKVAYASTGDSIEVWGDGCQTRSFLYIDECIEATWRLMQSDFEGPVNIGSEEMVTINQLVEIAAKVANKEIGKNHVDVPHTGVRGRNSNNDLIREKLGWDYSQTLEEGMRKTYNWIMLQIAKDFTSEYE
jgi:nucleoside-diphosphate-sugar epimerase|tara:strand:+ start:1380 stop:2474 length:1095 start_codon:yes stop_codon:yes gene_type:complete